MNDLLKESIANAAEEHGAVLSEDVLKDIMESVSAYYEYASYSRGGHCPEREEISALKKELERERGKQICGECKGTGRIYTPGPHHSSVSSCWRCNASGFVY